MLKVGDKVTIQLGGWGVHPRYVGQTAQIINVLGKCFSGVPEGFPDANEYEIAILNSSGEVETHELNVTGPTFGMIPELVHNSSMWDEYL